MTNSDDEAMCEEILGKLLALLDEAKLQREIDYPIQEVLQRFCRDLSAVSSMRQFNAVIAGLVQQLHRDGLAVRRSLTTSQALAEAIVLLEGYYRGADAPGYAAAFLDAVQFPPLGQNTVLATLAGTIAAVERQKYTKWILARTLGPLVWSDRSRLVALLLHRYGKHLPPQLTQCPAEQLADDLPSLLLRMLDTLREVDRLCG